MRLVHAYQVRWRLFAWLVPVVMGAPERHCIQMLVNSAAVMLHCTLCPITPHTCWHHPPQVLANSRSRQLYDLSRERGSPSVLRAAAASGVPGAASAAYDDVEVRRVGRPARDA